VDTWRYYELTHSTHDVMNPTSPARLDALADALRLDRATSVLDVACGHAELLLRWHERHGAAGVGVEASPYAAARAHARVAERGAGSSVTIVHGRGEDFETAERFDVACCVGASWIWNGHEGTLRALAGFVKPGGAVVTGEPYWKDAPPPEYLAAEGVRVEGFHSLEDCHRIALDLGLELVWMARSTAGEWDEYEMRQCAAVDAFARAHPGDADLAELRARRRQHDEAYLRWGRACLGWALWAFRVPA
jgi:SAM-dependent methyltransferase